MQLPYFLQNRTTQIIIGVIIVVILALIGVAVFFPPQEEPLQVVGEEVTLTWWKPFGKESDYEEIIQQFQSIPENQGVQIEFIEKDYSDQYYQDLITAIARNTGPDIFTIRNDDLPAYKEFMTPNRIFQGQFLTEYKDNFVDLAVRDTIDRNSVFAVTSNIENLQLYYNKDILNQSGIAKPPEFWSDLERQLPLINKRDLSGLNFSQSAISFGTGRIDQFGGSNINRMEDIIPMLIYQNGGEIYDYQTNQSALNGESENQIKDALRYYLDFANPITNRYSWNSSANNNVDAFVQGRLAYMVHFSYMEDTILARNRNLNFDIAPIPQVENNPKATYGYFFMDGLNRELEKPENTAKRRAAENFMYYLSLEEVQANIAAKTKSASAHKNVISEQLNRLDSVRTFANGALVARNYFKPQPQATEALWGDIVYCVQFESKTLDDCYETLSRDYNTILNEGPKV